MMLFVSFCLAEDAVAARADGSLHALINTQGFRHMALS